MSKDFDISRFEAADTATLQVLDQKKAPLLADGKPVMIVLYGPGSAEYVKAQSRLDSAQATRTIATLRGKPLKDSIDEQRRQQAEKLAACTHSIQNFPVAPLDLYLNPKLGYITSQVIEFVEDWANFTPGSATN